jgi:hypothetical protein
MARLGGMLIAKRLTTKIPTAKVLAAKGLTAKMLARFSTPNIVLDKLENLRKSM